MIDLNGIKVKNPYFIGSGPIKYGQGYAFYENPINFFLFQSRFIDPEHFGGVVTKTITLEPRKGNYRWHQPWKVLRRVPDGWLNRFGWNNCGIKKFRDKIYPQIRYNNLIPSIGALKSPREFLIMLDMLNKIEVLAIELNISCPHVDIVFRNDLSKLKDFFFQAVKQSRHPLIVKLGPTDSPVAKAAMAEHCGIKAICAINTVPTKINGFGDCGMSGPGIKPIALEVVRNITRLVNIPVIGGGGIESEADCQDFFNAGARAVFFASAFLNHPLRPGKIVKEAQWTK